MGALQRDMYTVKIMRFVVLHYLKALNHLHFLPLEMLFLRHDLSLCRSQTVIRTSPPTPLSLSSSVNQPLCIYLYLTIQ